MPRRTYDGPHDAVDLVGVGTVKRGETVEIPAALAKNLGPDWVAEPRRTRTTTKKKEG